MSQIISTEDKKIIDRYDDRRVMLKGTAIGALFLGGFLTFGIAVMKPKTLAPEFATATNDIIQIPYVLNRNNVRIENAEDFLWASIKSFNGEILNFDSCGAYDEKPSYACYYYGKANDEQKKYMKAQLDLRRNDTNAFKQTVAGLELNKIYENPEYKVNYKVAYAFDKALYGQPKSPWLVNKISDMEQQNAIKINRWKFFESTRTALWAIGSVLLFISELMKYRLKRLEKL